MRQIDQLIQDLPKTQIKSKAKVKWVFDDELQIMIEDLTDFLDAELEKLYERVETDVTKKFFKMKIVDDSKYISKFVKCNFEHTKADEKFFNTRILFTFTENSKPPVLALVWRFNIWDIDIIKEKCLKVLVKWIEQIID